MDQMSQKLIEKQAPDFTLSDVSGKQVSLSEYRGKNNIVLVFNRSLH
jgi:peroxiredoxin